MKNSDFYIVLPSNGCPNTQPNNISNSYIIDWESPLNLEGNWEVALTEYSLPYVGQALPGECQLIYSSTNRQTITFQKSADKKLLINGSTSEYDTLGVSIKTTASNLLEISYTDKNFELSFDYIEEAHLMGFNDTNIKSNNSNKIFSDIPFDLENLLSVSTMHIIFPTMGERYESILFPNYILFTEREQLVKFFNEHCSAVFHNFRVDPKGFVKFVIKPNINYVTLDTNMAKYLGFGETYRFRNEPNKTFTATFLPLLSRAFRQIYIYSDIAEAILVGGVKVPLLRAVWVESKYKEGDLIHESIMRPMYLPVSSNSLNHVEVELREDSGELIRNIAGSITSLTLHLHRKS